MMETKMNYRRISSYENSNVISRIAQTALVDNETATRMFDDLKLFLFLAGNTKHALAPTSKIDEAWHAFLMYTAEYKEFCEKYIGRFIHHRPYTSDKEREHKGKVAYLRAYEMAEELTGNKLSENWELSFSSCEKCGSDFGQSSCSSPDYDCDSEGGNLNPGDWKR